jgi:hypothetical protein
MQFYHPSMVALRRSLASASADRQLPGVVLVWGLCCLAVALCIANFGMSLPFCDEWPLTHVASGRELLSLHWVLEPANEHRAPLTRLWLFALGRLSHWNWQAMHYANLATMGLGALALVFAARALRGQAALSDVFLPLIVLTPWHFETLWVYGYAYSMAGGMTCLAISLAAVRWPQRSLVHLGVYLLAALVVTLSEGPAGNFLALGLAGVLLLYCRGQTPRSWRAVAIAGVLLILAASCLQLAFIPTIPRHAQYLSDSLATTLKGIPKVSVCWMGMPALQVLWPWVFLVVLVPGLWVVGRIGRDLLRRRRSDGAPSQEWADLGLVWLGAMVVAAAIAHGRARMALWEPRYVVLTMPIAIVLYLLLVRMRAPLVLPQTLAVVMAVCWGWCWPWVLDHQKAHSSKVVAVMQAHTRGDRPLSELCSRLEHNEALGWTVAPFHVGYLIDCMMQLRQNDLGIFRSINRRKRAAGAGLPQAWKADTGQLSSGWEVVEDSAATQMRTLRVKQTDASPALAVYRLQVFAGGRYRLCCRMRAPQGQTLTVAVDDNPVCGQDIYTGADYRACLLDAPLELKAGEHLLALAFSKRGTEVDVVELVPEAPATGR